MKPSAADAAEEGARPRKRRVAGGGPGAAGARGFERFLPPAQPLWAAGWGPCASRVAVRPRGQRGAPCGPLASIRPRLSAPGAGFGGGGRLK